MFIAYCILAVLYSAMLIFSGITKLQHHPEAVQIIHHMIGVPLGMFPVLGALLIAGAVGLLAGVRYVDLGVAAAAGLVLYFLAAIASHIRVGDMAGVLGGPLFMMGLAITMLILGMKRRAR